MPPTLIIVAGLPATGKTTIAQHLSRELDIPAFHKDTIKELLFDNLTPSTGVEWSKALGNATFQLLDYIAETMLTNHNTLILEANYHPSHGRTSLTSLAQQHHASIIQIHCTTEEKIRIERFHHRHYVQGRHLAHHANINPVPASDQAYQAIDLPSTLITIDTTNWNRVDLPQVTNQVRAALQASNT